MIVLDTQSLIFWATDQDKLSPKAVKKINKDEKNGLIVSSISIWEICMLVKKGRLNLTLPLDVWLKKIRTITFSGIFAG